MKLRFLSAGDRALVVELGDRVDRGLSERVLRLDAIIRSNPPAGIVETVPTFRSLAIYYDPLLTSQGELQRAIELLLDFPDDRRAGARLWHVPVCYEGEFAPDLAEVARLTGLTPNDVVEL
ncbi:MAG TPA: carboxyltransferase domain-containing protein, partial [Stellaceae bacterium]|nr:carboxyltransferase domain-containing protein [Stellaceae bacterium]